MLALPRSGQQKGAVENLVGWVKGSFFKVRRFHDRADLDQQLITWLEEVNLQRPSRATNEVPVERMKAQVRVEAEQLRSSLLSSVSHDLRTPLASITGTISGLLEDEDQIDRRMRRELLQSVYEEVERLNRLVNNLLDMMRLESGAVTVKKEWHLLEEVVGTALTHMEKRLHDRSVNVHLASDQLAAIQERVSPMDKIDIKPMRAPKGR